MLKGSVCIDLIMADMPFLDRIDRVADSGFKAFEFWFWTGKDLDAIVRKKLDLELEISIINCSSRANRNFEDWRYPCLTDPANRADFLRAVGESIDVARTLDCSRINLLTGSAQPQLSAEDQRASVAAGLREAAPLAGQAGVTLTLEALNVAVDHAGYFLSAVKAAMEILREVDHPNVKMLFDIYHQQVTEGNVIRNLTENIARVGHIHVADVPGRHEPGTGELNYQKIFEAIDKTGYDGYVGLEYEPLGEVMTSLAQVRAMLGDGSLEG